MRSGLDNSVLANALTSTRWSSRLLGGNDLIECEFRPIWTATANNPVLTEELIRRTVRIRLDAETDRPGQRTGFRHPNLRAWATAQRGALIAAALTLVRAWVVAGRPVGTQVMGSFESYAEILGGILAAVAVPAFLGNLDELYEVADAEGAQWGRLVELWAEKYGYATPVGVGDLYTLAVQIDGFDLGQSGNERSQKTKFGMLLAKQRDKIYSDKTTGALKITYAGKLHRVAQWQLKLIRPATPTPECVPCVPCVPSIYAREGNLNNSHNTYIHVAAEGKGTQGTQGTHFEDPTTPPVTPCLRCGDTAWFWSAASTWECANCM